MNWLKTPYSVTIIFPIIVGFFCVNLNDFHFPVIAYYTDPEAHTIIDGNITKLNALFAALAGITGILFAIFHAIKKDEEFLLVLFKATFFFPILAYFTGTIFSIKLCSEVLLQHSNDPNIWARLSLISTFFYLSAIILVAFMFFRLVTSISNGYIMDNYYNTFIVISSPSKEKEKVSQRRKRNSLITNLNEAITTRDIGKLEQLLEVYGKILNMNSTSIVAGDPSRTLFQLFERAVENKNKEAGYKIISFVAKCTLEAIDNRNNSLRDSLMGLIKFLYKTAQNNSFDKANLTNRLSEVLKMVYRVLLVNREND